MTAGAARHHAEDRTAPCQKSPPPPPRRREPAARSDPLPCTLAQDAAPGKVGDQGGNAGTHEVGSDSTLSHLRAATPAPARDSRQASRNAARDLPRPASGRPRARCRFDRATSGSRTRIAAPTVAPDDDRGRRRQKRQDRPTGLGRRSRRPPRPAERAGRGSPSHLASPRRRPPRRTTTTHAVPAPASKSREAASGSPSPPPASRRPRSNRRLPSAAFHWRSASRPTI